MYKNRFRQVLVILAVLVTITINGLSESLPINGLSTKTISDSFQVFFVPAAYVFSIWGLIYLGLMAYALFQALSAQMDNPRLKSIGGLFILSCVANCAWIFLWHYELFLWTLVAMGILLGSLILIYQRLGIGKTRVSNGEFWMVRVPFSIYLGWITVATVANVSDVLYYVHWSAWGIAPQVWTAIMLAVALVIAFLVTVTRKDVFYLLVLVWAFAGIAVKFPGEKLVMISAWVAAALVALMIVVVLAKKVFKPKAA